MANNYNYKKIQEMRSMLAEEVKGIFPVHSIDVYLLVEQRLQTAVMAGLLDKDIKDEVPDRRVKDK